MQSPQRFQQSLRSLLLQPAQRSEISDDEFAGQNRDRRGRLGEEGFGCSDPTIVSPATPAIGFPAKAQPTLQHVESRGFVI